MPRPHRDDMRLQRNPEQENVADNIQNFVPDKLVLKPQRLLRQNLVPPQNHRVLQTPAPNLPQLQQLLDLLVHRKRPRRRDLPHIRIRIDLQRKMLRMNSPVIRRSARNLQRVARQRHDRRIPPDDRHRRIHLEILPLLLLLHRLRLQNQLHKRPRRTIQNRRLARVHLDDRVVDRATMQRAQHMFHRMNLRVTRRNRRAANQFRNEIDVRPNLRLPVKIDPAKHDPRVHRGGLERQMHLVARMERLSLDGDLA